MTESYPNQEPAPPEVNFSAQDIHFIGDTTGILSITAQRLSGAPTRDPEITRIFRARKAYIDGLTATGEPSADSVHLVWAAEGLSALHSREGTLSMGDQLRTNPLLMDEEKKKLFETATTLWEHRQKGIADSTRLAALDKHIAGRLADPEVTSAMRLAFLSLAMGAHLEQPSGALNDRFVKELRERQQPASLDENEPKFFE